MTGCDEVVGYTRNHDFIVCKDCNTSYLDGKGKPVYRINIEPFSQDCCICHSILHIGKPDYPNLFTCKAEKVVHPYTKREIHSALNRMWKDAVT